MLGQSGPGGWAAIVIDGGEERELSGAEARTTNQRMEIRGALEGLRSLDRPRRVGVYSDSAYVINCFRDKWYERWRRNGWKNAQKKPVENRDLWEALIAEVERHQVTWHKVAGHSGDPLNEPRRPPRRRRHRPAQGPHVRRLGLVPARPGAILCLASTRSLIAPEKAGWSPARGNSRGRKVRAPQGRVLANGQGVTPRLSATENRPPLARAVRVKR